MDDEQLQKPLNIDGDDLEEMDSLDDLDSDLPQGGIKKKSKDEDDDSFDDLAEAEDEPLPEDSFDDYDLL